MMKTYLLYFNSFISLFCLVVLLINRSEPTIIKLENSYTKPDIKTTNSSSGLDRIRGLEQKVASLTEAIAAIKGNRPIKDLAESKVNMEAGTIHEPVMEKAFWQEMDKGLSDKVAYDVDSDLDLIFNKFEDVHFTSSCEDSGCRVLLSSDNRRSLAEAKMALITNSHWGQTQFYVPPQENDSEYQVYIKM